MQKAYVKRVIEIFYWRPEDLDIIPEYFCEIGFCQWQSLKKLTDSKTIPESKITAGESGIGKFKQFWIETGLGNKRRLRAWIPGTIDTIIIKWEIYFRKL